MAEKRLEVPIGAPRRFCFGSDNQGRRLGVGVLQGNDRHFSFAEAVLRCSILSIRCVMA